MTLCSNSAQFTLLDDIISTDTFPPNMPMILERIFLAPAKKSPQVEQERIELISGMGIVGDRNFGLREDAGQNLTLIEAEEIESFCDMMGRDLDWSITRRNLITRGIRLNALVGREFSIGTSRLRGIELCEPCTTLGKLLNGDALSPAEVVKYWTGRGGLRADVLVGGSIWQGAGIMLDRSTQS